MGKKDSITKKEALLKKDSMSRELIDKLNEKEGLSDEPKINNNDQERKENGERQSSSSSSSIEAPELNRKKTDSKNHTNSWVRELIEFLKEHRSL
jgi:hypothetical protein